MPPAIFDKRPIKANSEKSEDAKPRRKADPAWSRGRDFTLERGKVGRVAEANETLAERNWKAPEACSRNEGNLTDECPQNRRFFV